MFLLINNCIFSFQIVSGSKYGFHFKIADTNCLVNQALSGCQIKSGDATNEQMCIASVVSFVGSYSSLTYSCASLNVAEGSTVGALTYLNVSDPEAKKALTDIIGQMNADSSITSKGYIVGLESVTSVSSQVINNFEADEKNY